MSDTNQSSITVEEAVAKIIGFAYLPDGMSLIESIQYMIDASSSDLTRSTENNTNNVNADEIRKYTEEHSDWSEKFTQAQNLLNEIEESIDKDSILRKLYSDTARNRLTKQSVYKWAKKHHNVSIKTWDPNYGTPDAELTDDELRGKRLVMSIALLVDELLSKKWPGWKSEDVAPASNSALRYFKKGKPNFSAIALDIGGNLRSKETKETEETKKTKPNPERSISDQLKKSIQSLHANHSSKEFFFTKREQNGGYRALVALYRLLEKDKSLPNNNKVINNREMEMAVTRFAKLLSAADTTGTEALIACILHSLRLAREKSW